MSPYSCCFDILLACNMSTISFFASLLEHCQCFPREDVFLILALGSVRGNTVPRAVFLRTLPRAQGVYWILWSLWIISSDISPVDSEYQEIHPYSALNIDSVKINTSLIMMRECIILYISYSYLAEALDQRRLSHATVPNHNHLQIATPIFHLSSKRNPPS